MRDYEEDIYTDSFREELLEQDAIDPQEFGFMWGYDEEENDIDEDNEKDKNSDGDEDEEMEWDIEENS